MSSHAPRRSTIQRRGTGPRSPLRVQSLRNFDYPEAILFDCDGVLCETERDGHRVTFNMTFKENDLDHDWDVDLMEHAVPLFTTLTYSPQCVAAITASDCIAVLLSTMDAHGSNEDILMSAQTALTNLASDEGARESIANIDGVDTSVLSHTEVTAMLMASADQPVRKILVRSL